MITLWFIGWSNGVLPVADYDFSIGSWELLIKLVAGGITLNKEKLAVHGLFLTVFPKIWHHVGTLTICVVTWTFQLSLWLVGKTSKNLLWPWGSHCFSWIMKCFSMPSPFALPPSRRVKLSFSSLQAQGSFLFITSNMDCTLTMFKTRVLSNLAFKATLMLSHMVTNITQRLPWTNVDYYVQRHFMIITKIDDQTIKLQNKLQKVIDSSMVLNLWVTHCKEWLTRVGVKGGIW